jgi:hypothetical protein
VYGILFSTIPWLSFIEVNYINVNGIVLLGELRHLSKYVLVVFHPMLLSKSLQNLSS